MNPFGYVRVGTAVEAIGLLSQSRGARVIAGGTNILDLMKGWIETPAELVDITALPYAEITETAEGLVIGALATMSRVAEDRTVRERCPLIAEALLAGATPQLRNVATIGGNLMQRTRCDYFRDTGFTACNKRSPGSGCDALDGENRKHAVLGTSDHCIATHPSDLAVALVALDAGVRLLGPRGPRTVRVEDFHLLPGETPDRETVIEPGELIVGVEVPSPPAAARSTYLKVRDRASFEFALASAAVLLEPDGDRIRSARVALGGVATKPWRSHEAESVLTGAEIGEPVFRAAAEAALRGTRPRVHNAYKPELARRTLVRALQEAALHDDERS
jgi:xanthine dehydrogenase YagS FAD-binding subunit